ncbi:MAG TPA: hypothetical protein VMZ91_07120 [Candidatus Paceibacterota bacterium]|nr:hypothetical protein [Candidatus Paceibacterota bacterium]
MEGSYKLAYDLVYDNQKSLLDAFNLFVEHGSKLDLDLRVLTCEEMHGLMKKILGIGLGSWDDYLHGIKEESRENLKRDLLRVRTLADRKGVLPFTFFEFDRGSPDFKNGFSGSLYQAISFEDHEFTHKFLDDYLNEIRGMHRIARGDIPYKIQAKDIEERQISICKAMVNQLVPERYEITYLKLLLNPRIVTHDHYFDSEICAGELRACDGKLKVWVKNEVDLKKILQRFLDVGLRQTS